LVDNNCEFSIPDYTGLAIATDNCDVTLTLTQSPLAGTVISGSGTVQEITITATDNAGNQSSCTFNITLDDTIAPEVICPSDFDEPVDANCSFIIPDYTSLAINSDNCDVAPVVTQSPDEGTVISGVGTTQTITFTITDADGNFSNCDFTISLIDTIAPVIDCLPNDTVSFDVSCEYTVGNYINQLIANDNCDIDLSYVQTPSEGTIINASQQVLITVTDDSGNQSTCTFDLIIEDTTAPEISCPADVTQGNDIGTCGAIVNYDIPTATDNCTVQSIALIEGLNSGDFFNVGTTVITYVATDGFGNTDTCSFNITVNDTELPFIICPNDIIQPNFADSCGAFVNYLLPFTSDNCGIDTLELISGFASDEFFPVGTTLVEYLVTDIHGNTNTCSFNVIINDEQIPEISECPENIVVTNDPGICGAVVTFDAPTATDNCAITSIVQVAGIPSGELYPIGTTQNSFLISDEAGNSIFCNFSVTVEDTEAPVIICPEDLILETDSGICGAVVNFNFPAFSDNCTEATIEQTGGLLSGDLFPVGTTELSFTVTDEAGNVSICTYNVIVNDTEAPIIECPEDIVTTDPIVLYPDPLHSDNCESEIELIEGLSSGDVFPHGFTTVTWVATDPSGNADTCSFTVLVNLAPEGLCDEFIFFENEEQVEIDVLANDIDLDGDSIFVVNAWSENGNITIAEDSLSILYSLIDPNFCGIDSVTYVIMDEYMAYDTTCVIIQVECFIDLIIPEGFSPNGDGVNDVLEILGIEDFPQNQLWIFNRWGHKVFEAAPYENNWDGRSQSFLTLGNGLLPKGTYFYVLDLGDGSKIFKGTIYLNY
jgi:gliding motility-associated-like protein